MIKVKIKNGTWERNKCPYHDDDCFEAVDFIYENDGLTFIGAECDVELCPHKDNVTKL